MKHPGRSGAVNSLYVLIAAAAVILAVLGLLLIDMGNPNSRGSSNSSNPSGNGELTSGLFMYCAAGIQRPVTQIAADYEREYGISIQLQYGGSNTLLNQIQVGKTGDLYLAADDSYVKMAQEKGLAKESIAVAFMRPVIVVANGNPKSIKGIDDLLREDVKTALGNPEQAAVGRKTRKLLKASGHWERLEMHVTETGVFQPTVPQVANSVKVGSVDAAIVWDTTVAMYTGLQAIHTPELDKGLADNTIGILTSSRHPTAALRFARYMAARDKGLLTFKQSGWQVVDGDKWAETPELTFYCGSVNRRAVEPIIQAFEKREGVVVNSIYNGCGILTAQMRAIVGQRQAGGFPDTYMACDVYYLKTVQEMFQDAVNVSDTEVVIVVPKGNPKNIKSLKDLTRPRMRVSVGQPDQCTIGVLTRQLLTKEGVLDGVMNNVKTQTATSAMLVPMVTTASVDATLAYETDTLAERDKIDVIHLNSPAAIAVQPFSISRSSNLKYMGRRLFKAISESRDKFEAAGFHWRLGQPQKTGQEPSSNKILKN